MRRSRRGTRSRGERHRSPRTWRRPQSHRSRDRQVALIHPGPLLRQPPVRATSRRRPRCKRPRSAVPGRPRHARSGWLSRHGWQSALSQSSCRYLDGEYVVVKSAPRGRRAYLSRLRPRAVGSTTLPVRVLRRGAPGCAAQGRGMGEAGRILPRRIARGGRVAT